MEGRKPLFAALAGGVAEANSDNYEKAVLLYYPFLLPVVDLSSINPF
jgi:hypothetical protein